MKIMFVSLGCDKNLVDTENMLGLLNNRGYEFTDDDMQADIIVVNTCCFIGDAKIESINTILELAGRKDDAKCKGLIVAGCLAQRYRDEILKEIPEIDILIGTSSYDKIADAVEAIISQKIMNYVENADRLPVVADDRIITTSGYYEYLKIAEGCDKHCTYCIIPKVRGSYRSYPVDYLLKQAEYLVKNGVKELILVAQETTLYGTDIYGKKSLPMLLKALSDIDGLEWIRLLYCYPEEIDASLIEAIKTLPKVCHYIDMPIQHSNDDILKKMGRRTDRQELTQIINELRREIPDIAIRTTLITGFPGETEAEHADVMDFINEMEFDRLGVFTYSKEEDTPAASMDNQVDDAVKERWRDEIMALQQEISVDKSSMMVGKSIDVIIEGYIPSDDTYVGRSYKDAPDVDGLVFVSCSHELISGDIVKVYINGSTEYDLIGDVCE